jgi:hypothetical protein
VHGGATVGRDQGLDLAGAPPIEQLGAHAARARLLQDARQLALLGIVDGDHEGADPAVGDVEAAAALLPTGIGAVDEVRLERPGVAVEGDGDPGVALARALGDVARRLQQAGTRGRGGDPGGDGAAEHAAADHDHVEPSRRRHAGHPSTTRRRGREAPGSGRG